jgi:hypothetical protein
MCSNVLFAIRIEMQIVHVRPFEGIQLTLVDVFDW